MNKLIGLGLGAAVLLTANQTANNDNNNTSTKRQAPVNPDYKLVNLTAYFNDSTHYQQNVKSSNGFFYQKDDQTYFVATAHSIIDKWQSQEAKIANKIKISLNFYDPDIKKEDFIIKEYYYSRYFDVMIAKVDNKFGNYALKFTSKNPVKKVTIVYLDPVSNNPIEKEAEYVDQVASAMHLGAINHPLKQGSSGAPVVYNGNELVSMVTSTDQEYQNMTLCIPAKTIELLIDNYGEKEIKYLGIETNLITSGWLNSIPFNLSQNLLENESLGELVINSNISELNPFDIITKVNREKVGNGHKRSINIALANQKKTSFDIEGFKISQAFRDKYCAYPRNYKFIGDQTIVTKLIYKIESIEGNIVELDTVDNLEQGTYLKDTALTTVNYYLIKNIDRVKNTVEIDNNADLSNLSRISNLGLGDIFPSLEYVLPSYVYYTSILKDSGQQKFVNSETEQFTILKFDSKGNRLSDSDVYRNLILLALVKNWCFLIFNFIKTKEYAIQSFIINNEFRKLLDLIYKTFNSNKLKISDNLFELIYIEFFSKANEFLGPNCINIVKLGIANIINVLNFKVRIVEGIQKVNQETLPNEISSFLTTFDFVNNIIVDEDKATDPNFVAGQIPDLNVIIRPDTEFIEDDLDDDLDDDEEKTEKKKFVNLDEINKLINFNNFSLSRIQSEFNSHNSNLSDQTILAPLNDFKTTAKDLELVYQEIQSVFSAKNLDGNKLYYIKYYTNIKSYWDHAGYLLSHILQDPLLTYQPIAPPNNSVRERNLPEYLDTWQYNDVLGSVHGKGKCWITTYLHQENLLTKQDLETFSNLTFYGLKNHPDFTQAYRSTFQATMESFKQKASKEEWLDLQSWAHQILDQVKTNQLEEAFQEFKNKVLQLTNQYNPDLQFDSIEALDSYFMAKQIAKH